MSAPQTTKDPLSAAAQGDFKAMEERLKTFMRVTTSKSANVAQTPKQTIWTLNKAKLYRYTPVVPAAQRHPVPLLLVFAIMNRPYVLDLRPGNSFVEYMVKQGYDVYLLDWGAPGPDDVNLKFDDYALEYLPRAIRKVKAVSGTSEFSLLGWCLGALISTLYSALRPDDGLRNLILHRLRSLLTALGMRLNEAALHGWDVEVGLDPAAALSDTSAELLAEHLSSTMTFLLGFVGKPDGVGPARVAVGDHTIVIEDSVPGVTGAHAAGMTVLGFHGGSHCPPGHAERLRAAGAGLTFDDMRQLPELVRRIGADALAG